MALLSTSVPEPDLVIPYVELPSVMFPETVSWVPATSKMLFAPNVISPAKLDVPVEVAIVPPSFVMASAVE